MNCPKVVASHWKTRCSAAVWTFLTTYRRHQTNSCTQTPILLFKLANHRRHDEPIWTLPHHYFVNIHQAGLGCQEHNRVVFFHLWEFNKSEIGDCTYIIGMLLRYEERDKLWSRIWSQQLVLEVLHNRYSARIGRDKSVVTDKLYESEPESKNVKFPVGSGHAFENYLMFVGDDLTCHHTGK